MTISMIDY